MGLSTRWRYTNTSIYNRELFFLDLSLFAVLYLFLLLLWKDGSEIVSQIKESCPGMGSSAISIRSRFLFFLIFVFPRLFSLMEWKNLGGKDWRVNLKRKRLRDILILLILKMYITVTVSLITRLGKMVPHNSIIVNPVPYILLRKPCLSMVMLFV